VFCGILKFTQEVIWIVLVLFAISAHFCVLMWKGRREKLLSDTHPNEIRILVAALISRLVGHFNYQLWTLSVKQAVFLVQVLFFEWQLILKIYVSIVAEGFGGVSSKQFI
jgi:hypothetical protein